VVATPFWTSQKNVYNVPSRNVPKIFKCASSNDTSPILTHPFNQNKIKLITTHCSTLQGNSNKFAAQKSNQQSKCNAQMKFPKTELHLCIGCAYKVTMLSASPFWKAHSKLMEVAFTLQISTHKKVSPMVNNQKSKTNIPYLLN